MAFRIIHDDITRVKAAAIVNTANPAPVYAPGTDQAIYEAAGKEALLAERKKIGHIPVGEVAVTSGFALPAKYILHTVGPVWQGGSYGELEALSSCYTRSMTLAMHLGCESMAFPLISSGTYGFPKDIAIKVAAKAIYDFLMQHEMQVILVVYDRSSVEASLQWSTDLRTYIDENYTESSVVPLFQRETLYNQRRVLPPSSLQEYLLQLDESFSVYLLNLIRQKGLKNADVYHGANISKQHFSKMISTNNYYPTKNTVCALAISLRLNVDEANQLLAKAGMLLTHNSRFDLAIEYFLEHQMYNIVENNMILYENDLELLGRQ